MIDSNKILAIIPARGGSKGVPKKNIKLLSGKPLIHYTLEAGLSSSYIDRIVLSSESDEVLDIASDYTIDLIERPLDLATDDTPMNSVIRHAIDESEKSFNEKYDYILLLQPTTPFRTSKDIDYSIEELNRGDFDGVISVKRVFDYHPARMKKIEDGILKPLCMKEEDIPRQKLKPPAFLRNGAIYVVRKSHFLQNNTYKDGRMKPYIMPDQRSVNIDEPIDFEFAEFLMSKEVRN